MATSSTPRFLLKWLTWAVICGFALGAGILAGRDELIRTFVADYITGGTPERAYGKGAVTILALGVDATYHGKKRSYEHTRSDAMMVARLDFDRNRAFIISIPRDTYVAIPGYRSLQKINAAHALGGAELAQRTVENMLGIEIDQTIVMNFDGFSRLVDEVGGVPVDVDKNMNYDDNAGNLHIHIRAGHQVLDGKDAMGYVRFRHTDDDFRRSKRQRMFLVAFLQQAQKQGLTAVPRLSKEIQENLDGVSGQQLAALMRWGMKLQPDTDVKSVLLPTRYIGSADFGPDADQINRLLSLIEWPRTSSSASIKPKPNRTS
jgi:LCP family protein required for cell wall assembly